MLNRSLTDVYVLMRNNAFYSQNIYHEGRSDFESLLQKRNSRSRESASGGGGSVGSDEISQAPPIWIDKFEETQFLMSKVEPKMEELVGMHKRHILRPMLAESDASEAQIEELSHEILRLISSAQKSIDSMRAFLPNSVGTEQRLLTNVIRSLLKTLQGITATYRSGQNEYMKQLTNREKTSSDFFDELNMTSDSSPLVQTTSFDNFFQPSSSGQNVIVTRSQISDENVDEFFEIPIATRYTQKQLQLIETDNTELIETREKEVLHVVKSIQQLNEIYKELGQMVQEQGTVLDRIDYNIETTQVKVTQGYEQLKRAEYYQRRTRKLCCIYILAAVTLVLLVLLIIIKF